MENMEISHHEKGTGHCLGVTCDYLQQSAKLLEAQNRRKMAYFIALCGRALCVKKGCNTEHLHCNNYVGEITNNTKLIIRDAIPLSYKIGEGIYPCWYYLELD